MSDAELEQEFMRRGLELHEASDSVDYEGEEDQEASCLLRDMRRGE